MTEPEPQHCIGCGAQIQTTDLKQPGYTPPAALNQDTDETELYC